MELSALERVLGCPTLPSLPAVAVRVIDLTKSPTVSMDELAEVIRNDQGLATKILRTVNSSYYGLRRRCSTISQALVMLGMSTVKTLALSFSLVSALGDKSPGFDYVAYWRRGLYSAVAARAIARRAKVALEEEAFLSGLLQDVGMMALKQGLGREYVDLVKSVGLEHGKLATAELGALETTHSEVGALLAERWKLPDELIVPVRFHERPTAAPSAHVDVVRCVALGNLVHDALTLPDARAALNRFASRLQDWFDLSADIGDELIRQVASQVSELGSLFKLDTGAVPDADAILDSAQAQREDLAANPAADPIATLVSDADDADPFTGLLTQVALTPIADNLFDDARNSGAALTVLAVAVDGYAVYAKQWGPDAGDAVMVELAATLQKQIEGAPAHACRWHENIVVLVLFGVDQAGAMARATAIRAAVESESIAWKLDGRVSCTASVGTASLVGGRGPYLRADQLISSAIRALNAAAAAGGNSTRAFVPRAAA
ncbi:MAG: HDOD domain-containing protein [Phycisphaerales bacterium]